ncbi:MAG: hypothetical protein RR058_01765 [Oscillospiraceae bacterium]
MWKKVIVVLLTAIVVLTGCSAQPVDDGISDTKLREYVSEDKSFSYGIELKDGIVWGDKLPVKGYVDGMVDDVRYIQMITNKTVFDLSGEFVPSEKYSGKIRFDFDCDIVFVLLKDEYDDVGERGYVASDTYLVVTYSDFETTVLPIQDMRVTHSSNAPLYTLASTAIIVGLAVLFAYLLNKKKNKYIVYLAMLVPAGALVSLLGIFRYGAVGWFGESGGIVRTLVAVAIMTVSSLFVWRISKSGAGASAAFWMTGIASLGICTTGAMSFWTAALGLLLAMLIFACDKVPTAVRTAISLGLIAPSVFLMTMGDIGAAFDFSLMGPSEWIDIGALSWTCIIMCSMLAAVSGVCIAKSIKKKTLSRGFALSAALAAAACISVLFLGVNEFTVRTVLLLSTPVFFCMYAELMKKEKKLWPFVVSAIVLYASMGFIYATLMTLEHLAYQGL